MCQSTHEKLCTKVNKHLAPYLKHIIPYWLLAQADTASLANRIAESSFKAVFNQTKQPEVVYFAREEILNVLYDYLIVQTHKSLSDLKYVHFFKRFFNFFLLILTSGVVIRRCTTEDEALQKYETVVCMSLKATSLFLKYVFASDSKYLSKSADNVKQCEAVNSLDKLDKLFSEAKFWKYAKDVSSKIRIEFFQLIDAIAETVLLNGQLSQLNESEPNLATFVANLKGKIIPLVFYACDEDNQAACYFVWSCMLKCLRVSDNVWTHMNAKKAFLPKLLSLLKQHASGKANCQNVEIIYPALPKLVNKIDLIFETHEERTAFYSELFAKLKQGVGSDATNKQRFVQNKSKSQITCSLFDCLTIVIKALLVGQAPESQQFSNELITQHVNFFKFLSALTLFFSTHLLFLTRFLLFTTPIWTQQTNKATTRRSNRNFSSL
jgi:hypothetical protein